MGKKRIRIVNAEIEPQPQDPSHGSLGPNQSQDTLPLDHSLGPSASRSSALLAPQHQADDNSDEESTNIEVQITDHAGVRSTRGITRMSEIWNLTDGKKVQLSFNGCFQPVEREGMIEKTTKFYKGFRSANQKQLEDRDRLLQVIHLYNTILSFLALPSEEKS